MGYSKITMESINIIKEDIRKQGIRKGPLKLYSTCPIKYSNEHSGEYNCGCMINPHHFTICKLCDKHFKMFGELP